MKRISLLIAGLLTGAALVISILLTANLAVAKDPSESEVDALEVVVTPISEAVAEGENEFITKIVPQGEIGIGESEDDVVSVTVIADESADLPERWPEARGVLLEQSSSSYTIGSHATQMIDGMRSCQSREDGKVIEISITGSTRFVEDATDFNQAKPRNGSSDLLVQQVLKSVQQPEEMPECASILVWGKWQGEQLIAEVVLFHEELD